MAGINLSWTPATLPASRFPTIEPLDLSPISQGLDSIAKSNKEAKDLAVRQSAGAKIAAGDTTGAENELFNAGYLDQGIGLQNVAATQKRNAAQDQALLVNRVGGLSQIGLSEKDPTRKSAILNRMFALDPKMKSAFDADGIDTSNPDAVFAHGVSEAQGYKGFQDPNEVEAQKLGLEKTRAEIGKLNAESANAGSAYGKAGTIVQGSDGNFYSIQFGSGGQRKIEKLELGATSAPAVAGASSGAPTGAAPNPTPAAPRVSLAPSRGVDVVGDQMFDKATGAPVRNVAGNIAAGETAKVVGKQTGEGQMRLPAAKVALDLFDAQNGVVDQSIDKAINQSNAWTTGSVGATSRLVPGTAAYDLSATLDTIKSNLGFDKLQAMRDASPTGGALGQVSEQENRLLQSVWGSVEQSQSREQLLQNLNQIKAIRQMFADLKHRAYEQDVARFGRANVPNPDTGQIPGQGPQAQPLPVPTDWRSTFKRVE